MKIHVIEYSCAHYRNQKPFAYSITAFNVKKDKKNLYIRDNVNENDDQTYDDINTYKEFNKDQEYDYEDEVLNYPRFHVFNDYEISGSMPVLEENLDKFQDIIFEHIERKFQEKLNRITAMINSAKDKKSWINY